ncbi:hypothetical protein [Variovorax sp. 38R]|uniref:hypothetical protein n=1 Tax=Variovorax sp. 38R TaxID=2774875 RepID=UPI00178148D0|nr:hypothetical protein [Variovorax sp. 38R]QOF80321.1 hypothetical protein IG196_08020 [Variovorax sp. 38R]
MNVAESNLMTVSAFSVHLGYGRTYGYQLQKEGRLVMAEDGKRVLVAESIERVRATEDPSKQGVAGRHAQARRERAESAPVSSPSSRPALDDDREPAAPGGDGPVPPGFDFQGSKAKREHFAALEAEASYRARVKELLEASEVRAVINEVMTVLRTSIEGIAHRVAPALAAEVDEAVVRSTLNAEIRHALETASSGLSKLGR